MVDQSSLHAQAAALLPRAIRRAAASGKVICVVGLPLSQEAALSSCPGQLDRILYRVTPKHLTRRYSPEEHAAALT